MAERIFRIDDSGRVQAMRAEGYVNELQLQELLAKCPDLLPEDLGELSQRRWLFVAREMAVPDGDGAPGRWSLDHLFLDQDAIPTLVEVKMRADGRIRREVVGQLLDYAANATSYWPIAKLREAFDATHEDPEGVLSAFLGVTSGEEYAARAESFWQQTKANLQAGRIRLVFLADELPQELKRIIEFLNNQMDPAEVLGVELRQFVEPAGRTIIPSVFGVTATSQQRKALGAEQKEWDEAMFCDRLRQEAGDEAVEAVRALRRWSEPRFSYTFWGAGRQVGYFTPILSVDGGRDHGGYNAQPFAVTSGGKVEILFTWLKNKAPFDNADVRQELRNLLNQIPGVQLSADNITGKPAFSLKLLYPAKSMEQFEKAIEMALARLKAKK